MIGRLNSFKIHLVFLQLVLRKTANPPPPHPPTQHNGIFLNKKFALTWLAMTQGQEVEFHEIEIQLFQEVEFSFMRSKFLIMI
jgi:hypothetical protein